MMPNKDSDIRREFAVDAVKKLRDAGFQALWAGGCVRDMLLNRTPKDYDVASNALPEQVRDVFGYRRTLAVGAAFGVITVLGPKGAGQIEVAAFRQDLEYSDGRRPDGVVFSTAEEDALRRDFTINGLFFDPLQEEVIDYVGGRADLDAKIIRAIGDPFQRIAEDKLRMLRAVRFASAFDFAVDPATFEAVRKMADQIDVVSPERIAMEMRRMLTESGRAHAVRLLVEAGLAARILPEIVADGPASNRLTEAIAVVARLHEPTFAAALAALLRPFATLEQAEEICRRWRVSNDERDRLVWLLEHKDSLRSPTSTPWSVLQPMLIADGIGDLLNLLEATSAEAAADAAFCRNKLTLSPEELNPPPLVTGADLLDWGVSQGPQFGALLKKIRAAQLDDKVHSKNEARLLVDL